MLTRLEVDGFKNLVDFKIDFGPCTCIAGPNGIGKSNIFDAIHFLSLLADHSIIEAATLVRTATGDFEGLDDLFFRSGNLQRDSFKVATEMLIPPDVSDDFGRPCRATSTFLRYEIEIGRKASSSGGLDRPFDIELRSETLTPIRKGDAGKRLRFPHSKPEFRDPVVQNRRFAKSGYIGTVRPADGGEAEIVVYQDGGSRGPGQRAPARMAPRTIVGTTSTIATPTILAARREMQSWRLLSLEPSAMRKPDRLGRDPDLVSDSGEHLAGALHRLKRSMSNGDDPVGRISSRLSELVPVREGRCNSRRHPPTSHLVRNRREWTKIFRWSNIRWDVALFGAGNTRGRPGSSGIDMHRGTGERYPPKQASVNGALGVGPCSRCDGEARRQQRYAPSYCCNSFTVFSATAGKGRYTDSERKHDRTWRRNFPHLAMSSFGTHLACGRRGQ